MVLVHYDEANNKVCWVDNSDSSLKVQTTTVENFRKRWQSWVLVVYADNDFVPEKIYHYAFPVLDAQSGELSETRGYIPFPMTTETMLYKP